MPKSIKRKEGGALPEDKAQPVSEVHSGITSNGDFEEDDIIEIDLGAAGGVVTRATAKGKGPPRTTYRSPSSVFQHIVPTQSGGDGHITKPKGS